MVMAESTTTGRQTSLGTSGPWLSAKLAASLTGSFFLFQVVHVGLISDSKIGAGVVRAQKVGRVLEWTKEA